MLVEVFTAASVSLFLFLFSDSFSHFSALSDARRVLEAAPDRARLLGCTVVPNIEGARTAHGSRHLIVAALCVKSILEPLCYKALAPGPRPYDSVLDTF